MRKLVLVLLIMAIFATPALAGDAFSSWANSDQYARKVPGMILRGATNAVVSPLDVLMGPVHEYKDHPGWAFPLTGLLRGVQNGLDRLGRAVVDVGGSVFPKFNGFPDYKPCPLTGRSLGGKAKA